MAVASQGNEKRGEREELHFVFQGNRSVTVAARIRAARVSERFPIRHRNSERQYLFTVLETLKPGKHFVVARLYVRQHQPGALGILKE